MPSTDIQRRFKVDVRDKGATGLGTVIEDGAIDLAVADVVNEGGGVVYFPKGIYRISTTRTYTLDDVIFLFDEGAILDVNTGHSFSTPGTSPANLNSTVMLQLLNCNRVKIIGGTFRQDRTLYPSATNVEWNHQVALIGSHDIDLIRCRGITPASDFLVIGRATHDTCTNIRAINCYTESPKRLGYAIINAEGVEIKGAVHYNPTFSLDNGDSGISSVYGSFLDCEAEGLCVTRDIKVHRCRSNGGNLLLYSTDSIGEDTTQNIRYEYNDLRNGVISFRGADDFSVSYNTVRVEINTEITVNHSAFSFRETSAPGGRAGTNRQGKIIGNKAFVSGTHATRRGFHILALTDSEFSHNYCTGAVRGTHLAGAVDLVMSHNKMGVGNTYGLWVDNLFSVRTTTVATQPSDRITMDNNHWGRMRALFNTDAEVTSKDDNARNDATEAVNISVTGANPIILFDGLKVRYTGAAGSAINHSATSATARVVYSDINVDSGSVGFTASGGSRSCQVKDSRIAAVGVPFVQGASVAGDYVEIVNTKLIDTSGVPTIAFSQGNTLGTCLLAGNTLIGAFTTPFRLRNTGNNTRDQFMENSASPSISGWANAQTWGLGSRMRNSAPAAGGVAGWVLTAIGSPGTWNAEANIAP